MLPRGPLGALRTAPAGCKILKPSSTDTPPSLQAMSEGVRLLSAHHGDLTVLQSHLGAARRRSVERARK